MESKKVYCKTAQVNGLEIFYREVGDKEAPTVLLLHGFPTSSHMFRDLIPMLANKGYHVVAPDLPGFGYSSAPDASHFAYTFDNLANVIGQFIDVIGLNRFAVYVFDYGAPVGLRIALANPEKVSGVISQNGNAYEEGLGDAWDPIRKYWNEPTIDNRNALRAFLKADITKWQYTHGVSDPSIIAPESYTLDQHFLDRDGNEEIQLDLFLDYKNNVALYPKFHKYFSENTPPFLAVWGKHDPFFLPPGAEAFKRDNPNATVNFYDTGHFALETHCEEIGGEILAFLHKLQWSAVSLEVVK